MNNADIVREACRIVWTEGDVSRISEFYADSFTTDYPMTQWGEGLEGIKRLAEAQRTAFPDYRESIEELYDAGGDIIVVLTIRGTNTGPMEGMEPTGKQVEFRDVTICRVEGGKIIKQSGLSDYFMVYKQLGLIDFPGD
jgi:predicted ester cyclase